VERSPHHRKVQGSSLAIPTGKGREEMEKKLKHRIFLRQNKYKFLAAAVDVNIGFCQTLRQLITADSKLTRLQTT
jgi:hypothetical protein